MKTLERRVHAIEATMPPTGGRLDLDSMSTPDLERLESIVIDMATTPTEEMSDYDLRFMASIRVLEAN